MLLVSWISKRGARRQATSAPQCSVGTFPVATDETSMALMPPALGSHSLGGTPGGVAAAAGAANDRVAGRSTAGSAGTAGGGAAAAGAANERWDAAAGVAAGVTATVCNHRTACRVLYQPKTPNRKRCLGNF